ncbi:Dual specificity phosphatase [Macleaya cordata]|uniref:phosphatidylglycerophosphatase n=1 Tax=Macleaya cordata TaxID=56857 RepID=A0A200Q2H3_MACCD|nr:Dual specificity phosphatase [Macleaya cordata]
MHIEELKVEEGELEIGEEKELVADVQLKEIVVSNAKRVFILIGARALFYPTLMYNVVRNKIQSEFRWWDGVDEFILLGAVPFPTDVPRLRQLGVHGVITLNEPYETLVPTSLYHAYGIDHLVIPTRDYLFAPSYGDICRAVAFIHKNASSGKTTYVHCKAGRGRSTTIVLCYLVQYRQMTPDAAFKYVKSIRSRVLLASSQWKAVQEFYYRLKVNRTGSPNNSNNHLVPKTSGFPTTSIPEVAIFDDSSVVVVTESDLDGYDGNSLKCGSDRNEIWAEVSLVYRIQFASQAALARLSCLRLGCLARQKALVEKLNRESSCSVGAADQLGGLGVDIHVYC